MSEHLAIAVIERALADAVRGSEEAWDFLTTPSECLALWCGHLEVDMRVFNETMARTRGSSAAQQVARLVANKRRSIGQRMRGEKQRNGR